MEDRLFEFAKHHHDYLNDYIKFADIKAASIITVNSLILTLTFPLLSNQILETQFFLAIFGTLILIAGIVCSVFVIHPRTSDRASNGLIFWENVAAFEDATQYVDSVIFNTPQELSLKMVEQNYFLANVCKRKYGLLRISIQLTFLAFILYGMAASIWLFF